MVNPLINKDFPKQNLCSVKITGFSALLSLHISNLEESSYFALKTIFKVVAFGKETSKTV
jgi:hypothetical protein